MVIAQALLTAFLITQVLALFYSRATLMKYALILFSILSFGTGISWVVSQIMPDIFTALALLCMLLLFQKQLSRSKAIIYGSIYTVSVAMHISHFMLFIALLVFIFFFRKFILPLHSFPSSRRTIGLLLLLTVITYPVMSAAIAKSQHAF